MTLYNDVVKECQGTPLEQVLAKTVMRLTRGVEGCNLDLSRKVVGAIAMARGRELGETTEQSLTWMVNADLDQLMSY